MDRSHSFRQDVGDFRNAETTTVVGIHRPAVFLE